MANPEDPEFHLLDLNIEMGRIIAEQQEQEQRESRKIFVKLKGTRLEIRRMRRQLQGHPIFEIAGEEVLPWYSTFPSINWNATLDLVAKVGIVASTAILCHIISRKCKG